MAKHLSPETVAEQCDYLAQALKERLGIDVPDEVLQELVLSPDKIDAFLQSWFKQQSGEAPTAADQTTDRESAAGTADEFDEDDADAFDDDGFE